MKPFETHEDIQAYRRLCKEIDANPQVFEIYLEEIYERAFSRATQSSGRKVFKRFLKVIKEFGERLAKEEIEYWQHK